MQTQSDPDTDQAADLTPGPTFAAPWRVIDARTCGRFRFRVRFADGVEGVVDMGDFLQSVNAGVFARLADEKAFGEIHVSHGAVCWPGGLDLAPDAMHDEISENGEWVLS